MSRISLKHFAATTAVDATATLLFYPRRTNDRRVGKIERSLGKNRETGYYYAVTGDSFLPLEATESRGRLGAS